MKTHNFSAGPCILPESVLTKASQAVQQLGGIDLSLIEISHRSKEFVAVLEKAQSLVKELLNLGDDYEVLFLTGGASSQFYMSAMNFLTKEDTAYFINTGTWSNKAIKEAKHFGQVTELATSKSENFNNIR